MQGTAPAPGLRPQAAFQDLLLPAHSRFVLPTARAGLSAGEPRHPSGPGGPAAGRGSVALADKGEQLPAAASVPQGGLTPPAPRGHLLPFTAALRGDRRREGIRVAIRVAPAQRRRRTECQHTCRRRTHSGATGRDERRGEEERRGAARRASSAQRVWYSGGRSRCRREGTAETHRRHTAPPLAARQPPRLPRLYDIPGGSSPAGQ